MIPAGLSSSILISMKKMRKNDFPNTGDLWKEEVASLGRICDINGIDALLNKGAESVNLKSFQYYDRMQPMQNHLPAGGLDNLIALPLQGQKRGEQ